MTTRSSRMTKLQKEVLVNYLINNRDLLVYKHPPAELEKVNTKWQTLVEILNSLEGAKKTMKQWKDALNEFKSNVKRKTRQIKCNESRRGPKRDVSISDVEEKLLSLLASIVVTDVKCKSEAAGSTSEDAEISQEDIVEDFAVIENTTQVYDTPERNFSEPQGQKRKLTTTSTNDEEDLGAVSTHHQNCMDIVAISNNNIANAINNLARSFQKRNKQSSVFNLKF